MRYREMTLIRYLMRYGEMKMKDIKEIAEENYKAIAGSTVFIQLHNKKMTEEPIPLMQLGLAIMLDKPIGLMVQEGEQLPEKLKKVADAITYFDKADGGSVKKATSELMLLMKDWLGGKEVK